MPVAFKTPVRESNPGSGGNGTRRSPEVTREGWRRHNDQYRDAVQQTQDKLIDKIKKRRSTEH